MTVYFKIENIEAIIKKACRPLLGSRSLEVITVGSSEKGGMAELDRKPRNHIVGIAILRVRMAAMGRQLAMRKQKFARCEWLL